MLSFALIGFNAQDAGIFESYAVLNINGAGNTYYDLQATTGNPDFNGADLGTFNVTTQSIVFAGGEIKTWKNGRYKNSKFTIIYLHKRIFIVK